METFAHTPFEDVNVPYIVYSRNTERSFMGLLETMIYTGRLPILANWVIYRAFKLF